MARAIATKEAVFAVADAIAQEGGEPQVIVVQACVGGGSYTTSRRLPNEWREQRASQPVVQVELPSEVADKAEELRLLWQSSVPIAQRNAQAVVDQAGIEVAAIREQRDETLEVVQRLEQLEVELCARAEAERQRAHDFELQVAGLQVEAKRVRDLESEVDALRPEYAQSADVCSTLSELRAQVGELLSARPNPGKPRSGKA